MGPGGDIGGAIGGAIGNMFGKWTNPAGAAEPYYNQIPGELKKYFDPYVNAGTGAINDMLPKLKALLGNLTNNPSAIQAKMGSNFKASPGYQYQYGQAMNAANNSAAAGGMAGSPEAMRYAEDQAQGLSARDYNNYMNRDMNIFGQGLSGTEQLFAQLFGGGEQASQGLGEDLTRALMSQGNLAQAKAQDDNQRSGGIAGTIGSLIGSFL